MTGQQGSDRDSTNEAITDPVSGVFSRALLDTRLVEELGRSRRSGVECSLFLLDVDYFKTINDAYGHSRGDRVLRQLADRITGLVRAEDVLFRYGGDEFVLVLPATDKVDAVEVALRVVEGVRSSPLAGDPPLSVSLSLGVATYPGDAEDSAELLEVADRRSYLAKRRGRACAVADDETDAGRAAFSRLLERDAALAAAQAFLTRLMAAGRGALRVTGERGTGHTRFLTELAKIARLRGLRVVSLPGAKGNGCPVATTARDRASAPAEPDAGVLVLVDGAAGWPAATDLLQRLGSETPGPAVLGLAYASVGRTGEPAGLELPVLDTVELTPWSSFALRVWLRATLQGEPSPALVNWLTQHSGGLPARAERELSRLIDRGGLERTATGGWTLAQAELSGRNRGRARLPIPLTELVGRHQETSQVAELLAGRRLVTLVGPGGIGKTRLSLAVATMLADTFDDGAVFVPLTETTTAETAVSALARALDIVEIPGQPLTDTLTDHLGEKRMLLVLDNFEQVMSAAPLVADLLTAAPALSALATSRERLRLSFEQVYPVPPLALPDLDELSADEDGVARALASSPALALFVARAQAVAYDFALTPANLRSTAELCHRLDGLPLAIELAAARIDEHPPEQLLAQLTRHLVLLGDGPRDLPSRQQTLRAAIEWSINLLDPACQRLLIRLGVFTGGCTLAAAATVCTAPAGTNGERPGGTEAQLGALVEKYLLRAEPDPDAGTRYTMLETIRAYAAEQVSATPEAGSLRTRHATYYMAFAEEAGRELIGPRQAAWLGSIERDYSNLRTAMTWALETGDPVTAGRIAGGIWRYWRTSRHLTDGREWLDRVLRAPASTSALSLAQRALLLHANGFLAAVNGDLEPARELATESLAAARRLGDPSVMAQALNVLGIAALIGGEYEQARAFHTEQLQLARSADDRLGMAMAGGNLTKVALRVGDLDTAHTLAVQNLAWEREIGNTRGVALTLECLGQIHLGRDEPAKARPLLEESMEISRTLGDVMCEARALGQLGRVAEHDGDAADAARLFGAAATLQRDAGERDEWAVTLENLARVAVAAHPEFAARLLAGIEAFRERYRLPRPTVQQPRWDATVAALRERLGDEALASVWSAGRETRLEALMDEALAVEPNTFAS